MTQGGTLAELAWVRLENYFSRFRLIPGLRCSLEVFAPTLSNVPIFVQAQTNTVVSLHSSSSSSSSSLSNISQGEECPWEEGRLEDAEQQHEEEQNPLQTIARQQQNRNTPERKAIFLAAQSFLKRPIKFKNVAHSVQPIRDRNNPPVDETTPKLEVAIIVSPQNEADSNDIQPADGTVAKLQLIRIVNQIPLLDNAEGSACGLVQKICNTGLWGSFGLQVEKSSESNIPCCTPQFDVRDSEQVAPFFQSQNHRLWEGRQEDSNDNEDLNDGDEEDEEAKKRKRRLPRERPLLPAKVRIGHLIVIVYIRAPPSSFSLPTLSKGRLPLNYEPIDSSLQMALRDCLRSLQATNPALLLTQAQLREAERETRYIPATALSVSRILRRMSNQTLREKWLDKISQWKNERDASPDGTRPHPELAGLIEARLKNPRLKKPVVRLGVSTTNSAQWTLRFEELKKFKETHGHCNISQRDPTNRPLGQWVVTQRKAYTKSKMSTERKEKLDAIGFDFVDTNSTQWTIRFEELKKFKETHGHCNVSQRDPTNRPLGQWVVTQRQAYTKNKMSTERKEKLDSIGFVFRFVETNSAQWTLRFEELKKFKETHGHCNVSQRDPTNRPLGQWVMTQRKAYTKNKMSTERKEKLDSIGFVFLGIRKRKAARISNDDDDGGGGDHDQDDTSNDQDEHDMDEDDMDDTAARISMDDDDGGGGDHDQDDTSNDQDEHEWTRTTWTTRLLAFRWTTTTVAAAIMTKMTLATTKTNTMSPRLLAFRTTTTTVAAAIMTKMTLATTKTNTTILLVGRQRQKL